MAAWRSGNALHTHTPVFTGAGPNTREHGYCDTDLGEIRMGSSPTQATDTGVVG